VNKFSDKHNVRENLLLAIETLRTHKFRSFLTVLGVLIGVFVIIFVSSVITGFNNRIADYMKDFGTRTLFIFKFQPGFHGRLTREERLRKPLSFDDAMAIRDLCPDVQAVGVELFNWGAPPIVKYKGEQMVDAQFQGVTPDSLRVDNAKIADGRMMNEIDDEHRRNVVLIGADVVTRLFPNEDPVGKNIVVNGTSFQIIGTLAKRKQILGDNGSDRVIVTPYWTYKKLYPDAKENFIIAQAFPNRVDQAMDEVTGLLRMRRKVKPWEQDSFGISTADSIIAQFHQLTGMIALVLVVLSSIGLLVGGIGVMNIMLVSVTERTREIGVRKAIGARKSDITWQFLLEAMTLTGAGGLLGIALGYFVSVVIRVAIPSLPSEIPMWSVVAGFVVSVSIGLFFGMWPALKAARLDPIVALRYE
jgi:putative ABC transport system permease protein